MTDRVERPALRNTLLGTLLRILNPVMRLLLGSALHWPWSRWWILLRWEGPRTGQPHTVPVSHVREGRFLSVTTGDRWWQRLVESPDVSVRAAGRWLPVRPNAVTDVDASVDEHVRLFRAHPWFRVLAGIPARGGRPDRDAVRRAIDAGRTLIRIELPNAAPERGSR